MLLCVCFEITDHRTHQNMVRESVTHLPIARWVPLFRSNHILKSPVIIFFFTEQTHSNMDTNNDNPFHIYALNRSSSEYTKENKQAHNKKTSTTTKHSIDVTESAVY